MRDLRVGLELEEPQALPTGPCFLRRRSDREGPAAHVPGGVLGNLPSALDSDACGTNGKVSPLGMGVIRVFIYLHHKGFVQFTL